MATALPVLKAGINEDWKIVRYSKLDLSTDFSNLLLLLVPWQFL